MAISIFPDNYRLLLHQPINKEVILLGSADRKNLRRETDKLQNYVLNRLPNFGGTEYLLALRGFSLYEPHTKRSPTSQAEYLACSTDKTDGLLLQVIPPFSKTSCHRHKEKREALHVIAGEATLLTSQSVWTLYRGYSHVIEPGVFHQTRTGSRPALIVVEITGDPEGISMNDYEYGDESCLFPNR